MQCKRKPSVTVAVNVYSASLSCGTVVEMTALYYYYFFSSFKPKKNSLCVTLVFDHKSKMTYLTAPASAVDNQRLSDNAECNLTS